jgi:hypothetical protein
MEVIYPEISFPLDQAPAKRFIFEYFQIVAERSIQEDHFAKPSPRD